MKRLAIILVNFIIVALVAMGVVYYARTAAEDSAADSREKFADTTVILEEIASNYLEDSQSVADRLAAFINGSEMTMEEAVSTMQLVLAEEDTSVQLVWLDTLTGLATEPKASNPDDYTVNYSKNTLSTVFSDISGDGIIHITHRFSNPQTGAFVVAFCDSVSLLDDGVLRDAVLMYIVPVNIINEYWTFPTEYAEEADVALIDIDGEYVIKPDSMKNEDFFSYIYSYNRGVIDEASLKSEMNENSSGTFEAADASGRSCFWVYSHLTNNGNWILVSEISEEILYSDGIDWGITIQILVALIVLFVIDISYFYLERRREKRIQDEMGAQQSIIGALAEDYSNVFVVSPETNHAEIVKLDGYVTADITKKTKEFKLSHIVGNYTRDRVHPDDKEDFLFKLSAENLNEVFRKETTVDYSYRVVADGEIHTFNAHFVRISEEGEPIRVVAGFRNIDSIIAEQEKSRKILEDALDAAQHANRAKTTFLNSMSHDIRTPMNAIIGFTSLAAQHIENSSLVKEYLGKIQVSSNHLLSLINDVLDMSRIESGKVKIVEAEVHLPDILHDLRTIVQADIKAKQLDFFIDIMDVRDEDIICDKLRLNQVLLNIVSNAIKFTPAGGHISVRIIQNPEVSEDYVSYSFRIKDTGIGMDKEFLDHIFEPFTRAQTATVSGIQGSGLGMAISKNIVDMMGGTISVKSEVGVGTEFIVDFRFRRSGNTAVQGPIPELAGSSALVVDDDMDCCMSVSTMLSEIGMRPEWTSSGREAVVRAQYAVERNDPFAVYVIDWLMPDMNGIETVRRIRRIIGDDKPIIVLTAYDWEEIETEAREAGVTQFVAKPIFMSELRDILAKSVNPTEEEPETEETHDFTGFKLLLVEDNELNREIAVDILEEVGFVVDTAEDGSIALERMSSVAEGTYDAILMDIQMSVMDGYEATRRIRKLPNDYAANIPIIAMTANAFEEDKQLAFEAGMNGHVAKPVDVPKLMQTLDEILK